MRRCMKRNVDKKKKETIPMQPADNTDPISYSLLNLTIFFLFFSFFSFISLLHKAYFPRQ